MFEEAMEKMQTSNRPTTNIDSTTKAVDLILSKGAVGTQALQEEIDKLKQKVEEHKSNEADL